MKLSEVRGDKVFDVIAGIIEPISHIASDKDVMDMFTGTTGDGGESDEALFMKKLSKAMPALMGGHKDDIVTILSTINGVSKAQYLEGLSLPSLIGDVYDIFTDDDLLVFLQRSETSGESA